jgi:hypothetical protein
MSIHEAGRARKTGMNDLEPLRLEDQERVESRFSRHQPTISEHTFTNLYMWRDSRTILLTEVENALVFAEQREEGIVLFGPPAGPITVCRALEAIKDGGEETVLGAERIPEQRLESVRDKGLEPRSDRDNYDYVYRQVDLAELPGRHLHSKRNKVEQCLRSHECEWELIGPDNLAEVSDLQDRWCDERDCGKKPGLCAEYKAIGRLLECYQSFDVVGGAVRVDGTLEAYTVGEALNDTTAVVHVEKAMPHIDGLYQVVNKWFCERELDGFELVNREQDLGIRGIRKAKKSYRPDHMVRKYWIELEPAETRPDAGRGRCH